MVELFFNFVTHLLFIFISFQLLWTVIDWNKVLKSDVEPAIKGKLLVFFLGSAIGFLVSSFFLSIFNLSKEIFLGNF